MRLRIQRTRLGTSQGVRANAVTAQARDSQANKRTV